MIPAEGPCKIQPPMTDLTKSVCVRVCVHVGIHVSFPRCYLFFNLFLVQALVHPPC